MTTEQVTVNFAIPDNGKVFKRIDSEGNSQYATRLNGVNIDGWQEVPISEYDTYKLEQERLEFEEFKRNGEITQ